MWEATGPAAAHQAVPAAYNPRVAKKASTEVLAVTEEALGANEHARGRFRVDADDTTGEGALRLRGWVLGTSSRATAVEILAGDIVVGQASVEMPRPDVAKLFPEFPDAATAGFKLILVPETGGESELLVRAVLESGVRVPIGRIRAKVARRRRLWGLRRG